MPIEAFQRLGLALAIGLLIGVERGWRSRDAPEGARTAGLRTYALIGLLGGIAAELGRVLGGWAYAAVAVPFAAAFVAFKLREQAADKDFSVTAVVAALLVFALGSYAVVGDWRIAAAAAVVVAGLLAFKAVLHGWLERLTWEELRSALVLLAMTFVALPLLPDLGFGPFGAVNPRELWILTIALAGISFAGYVAIKMFGAARGVVVAAVVGALVSSTASTLYLARRNRETPGATMIHGGSGLLVGAVMAGRVGAIALVLAPALFWSLAAPLAAFILVSVAIGLVLARRGEHRLAEGDAPPLTSPFELASVVKFALLLGLVMAAAKAASGYFGARSLLPVAAIAGLVDVDAITLTVGRMAAGGLDARVAADAVLVAAGVNTITKSAIAGMVGGLRLGAVIAGGSLLAAAAAGAALAWAPVLKA